MLWYLNILWIQHNKHQPMWMWSRLVKLIQWFYWLINPAISPKEWIIISKRKTFCHIVKNRMTFPYLIFKVYINLNPKILYPNVRIVWRYVLTSDKLIGSKNIFILKKWKLDYNICIKKLLDSRVCTIKCEYNKQISYNFKVIIGIQW